MSGEQLPIRPAAIGVHRDLSEMSEVRVLAHLWSRCEWARKLYHARRLTVEVLPVSMVPRNGVEGWPVREVRMTLASGVRVALVSLDDDGRPLVRVMPPGRATPRQS